MTISQYSGLPLAKSGIALRGKLLLVTTALSRVGVELSIVKGLRLKVKINITGTPVYPLQEVDKCSNIIYYVIIIGI